MFRIQKAVNKARSENRSALTPSPGFDSPLEGLRYTTTEIIPTHPDIMENKRVVAAFANNPISQVFKKLRTQVIQTMRQNQWRSLAITSPSEGEGKSLVAANLATAIAMEVNQTVLLVDLDLKNPTIADYFGIQHKYGIHDYIKGEATTEDILVNPGIDRLVLVPGRGTMHSSSEVVSGPRMLSFYNEVRSRYKSRIVIFDMPPVLPTDDVLSAIGNVDCSLLVLEDGRNPAKDIERALTQMTGSECIGYILNKFHKSSWII